MWKKYLSAIGVVSAVSGGLIYLTQTDPNAAKSNLDKWFEFFGLGDAPNWLDNPILLISIAVIFIIITVVVFYFLYHAHSQDGLNAHYDSYPNVRVADRSELLALLEGQERKKLIGLLQAGKLSSWARPMGGGRPIGTNGELKERDLIPLKGGIWITHNMEFHPKSEAEKAINQTFLRTREDRRYSTHYDLHMNSHQLKDLYPDLIETNFLDEQRKSNKFAINHQTVDAEIDRLKRDVARLVEMFTGYGGFESERKELAERIERLKGSDHLVWYTDPARQLRKDFLNRCGCSYNERKEYQEPRIEIKEIGDKLFNILKNYRQN